MSGRKPRPPLPQGIHNVPIIDPREKYLSNVTFELCGFKFHPPTRMDHMYVMMMVMLSGSSSSMYKTIHAFQEPGKPVAQVYLAEDNELGKMGDLVMVKAVVDEQGIGELAFMVARPVEDDPANQN